MKRSTALPFVVAALLVTAACSEPGRIVFPSSPTTVSIPRALPGAPPNATPISVGQNVRATVTLSDEPCEFGDGPEPCQQFSIVPSTSGTLWVQLSAAGPSELALKVAGVVRGWSSNRIEGTANVTGGQTYEVSVSLHYPRDGRTTQPFELTTTLAR